MKLFLTQKSYYFVLRKFISFFENGSEVIYIKETKRGMLYKYLEIAKFFGIINFIKLVFYEIYWKIRLIKRESKLKSYEIFDFELNDFLINKLNNSNYKHVISIGCPCILNTELNKKYSIKILNIHGGIIPYQKGRFSPIKSIINNHKYLGASLHEISNIIDHGKIISQDYYLVGNKSLIYNYNMVLGISVKILYDYFKNKVRKVPNDVLLQLNNGKSFD